MAAGNDEHASSEAARDPWSRDVAASDPIEIVFTDITTDDPQPSSNRQRSAAERHPQRRRWLAATGATVALAAVGTAGMIVMGSDDDGPASEPDTTIDAPPTTLPTLPTVPTEEDLSEENLNERSVGEIDFDGQLEQFPDDIPFTRPAPSYSALPRVWRAGNIAVPAELTEIAPVTFVVLTVDGLLREIDLPSGDTRDISVGTPAEFFTPGIAVGRSATLAAAPRDRVDPSGETFLLLAPGQPPIEVLVPLQAADIVERPGSDEFVGLGVDLAASSLEQVTIAADGTRTSFPIRFGPELSRGILRFTPDGRTLVADGGGVFAREADGSTTFIADGELIASSSHHILTRVCTELYVCSSQLSDMATGQRTIVQQLDPDFVAALADGTAQISPNGNWLRYRTTDFARTDRVLDLRTGTVTSLPAEQSNDAGNDVWANDSSGFFRLSGQDLEFVDPASAEIVSFADALGPVVDFGVRLDLIGTPQPTAVASVSIAPDLQLVGVDESGTFHDLDLLTGEVTSHPVDEPRSRFGRTIVLSNGDRADAVATGRGPSGRFDRATGASVELDDQFDGAVFRGPTAASLWTSTGTDPISYDLIDTATGVVLEGVSIPAGAAVLGSQGDGLVIVSEPGDVSVVRPDAAELLTSTGELLGLGATAMIVRECTVDGDGSCRELRIDRVSGERTTASPPDFAVAQRAVLNGAGVMVENTVSPDGEVLIGPTSNGPIDWVVSDLASGTVINIGSIRPGSRVIWTTSSSHAVFQSRSALFVYDRAAGRVLELVDAPPIAGFGQR